MSIDIEATLKRFFQELNSLENQCTLTDSDEEYASYEDERYGKEVLKRLQSARKLTEHIRTWATKIEELGKELEKQKHAKLWLRHINSILFDFKYNKTTTPEEVTRFLEDTIVYSKNYILRPVYGTVRYVDAIEYIMRDKTTPEWIEWERTQRAKQPEFLTQLETTFLAHRGAATLSFGKEIVSEIPEKKENLVGSDSYYEVNLHEAKHLIDAWIFDVGKINLTKPKCEPPESYSDFMSWVLSQLRRVIKLVCTCDINRYYPETTTRCVRHALQMPQFVSAADIIDEFVEFARTRVLEYMKENRMSIIQKKYIKSVFEQWSADKSAAIKTYPFLETSFVLKKPARTGVQLNFKIDVWQIGPTTEEYEDALEAEMQKRQTYIDVLCAIDGKKDLSIEVKNHADSKYVSKEMTEYFEKIIVVPKDYIDSYVDE